MNKDNFIIEVEKIGIKITEKKLQQLEKYYEMLIEYNKVMNLTGITEKKEVYLKHFYDSLTIAKIIDLTKFVANESFNKFYLNDARGLTLVCLYKCGTSKKYLL